MSAITERGWRVEISVDRVRIWRTDRPGTITVIQHERSYSAGIADDTGTNVALACKGFDDLQYTERRQA